MRYKLWKMSQCTNTTPNVVPPGCPTKPPRQAHRAISTTPTVSRAVAGDAQMGLGNPNAAAWSVFRDRPAGESTGLMLHEGT